jgi:hypothetical protein
VLPDQPLEKRAQFLKPRSNKGKERLLFRRKVRAQLLPRKPENPAGLASGIMRPSIRQEGIPALPEPEGKRQPMVVIPRERRQ